MAVQIGVWLVGWVVVPLAAGRRPPAVWPRATPLRRAPVPQEVPVAATLREHLFFASVFVKPLNPPRQRMAAATVPACLSVRTGTRRLKKVGSWRTIHAKEG